MVSNRNEVKEFIKKVSEANAVFLLNLTKEGARIFTRC